MYLHLGNDVCVNTDDVIGIFDIENTTVTKSTKELLERAGKQNHCVYTSLEMPKSFVITTKNNRETIFVSQLAAATLGKRLTSYMADF
ncbi:MAG: DUF370 domain-containing protein [Ruminococcus sp.]|jgi:hypothetical protein|nr:DUF370 domain-containing protein [Ruminococcus sp.]